MGRKEEFDKEVVSPYGATVKIGKPISVKLGKGEYPNKENPDKR